MGSHIRVDTRELADMGRSLGVLKSDFEHGTDIVGSYDAALGSGELADALHDFSTDWSKKRDSLCKGLDDLSTCASAAARTYDGVDSHLASALLNAEKGGAGQGEGT